MQQLSGVLGILKPGGITSAQVLELLKDTIRGQFHAVGHGGTLDPMTTGVLGIHTSGNTAIIHSFIHSIGQEHEEMEFFF